MDDETEGMPAEQEQQDIEKPVPTPSVSCKGWRPAHEAEDQHNQHEHPKDQTNGHGSLLCVLVIYFPRIAPTLVTITLIRIAGDFLWWRLL